MASPIEKITVICPGCGLPYQDWWRQSVNFRLDDFDDDYLEQCSSATCPDCGLKVHVGTLTAKGGVFIFGAMGVE